MFRRMGWRAVLNPELFRRMGWRAVLNERGGEFGAAEEVKV